MSSRLAPSIVIVDIDAGVAPSEVTRVATALQAQVLSQFAPFWGLMASVRAATHTAPARAHEWVVELRRVPSSDVYGFHGTNDVGQPVLYVFPELDQQNGIPWSLTASHEILETLVDPFLRRCVQGNDGTIWALEICDAVECDTYRIGGVVVSNFCTPEWGEPPRSLTGVAFDFMGLCKTPFEVRPGGYGQIWNSSSKTWSSTGTLRPARAHRRNLGVSRGLKRSDWNAP